MKKSPKESSDLLYEGILKLGSVEECRKFFEDLCTVSELCAMEQRMEVAMYLQEGKIYNEILDKTGASSATISRVNRALRYGAEGYQLLLPRLEENWAEHLRQAEGEEG